MIDWALFSSVKNDEKAKDNWRSPRDVFDHYNEIHKFTIDLAADRFNALCPKYYDEEMDSLKQDWEGVCWLNSPYSLNAKFVDKCISELIRNYNQGTFLSVHLLIPSRTCTKYFHALRGYTNDIGFFKGRLKFECPEVESLYKYAKEMYEAGQITKKELNKLKPNTAPFPSCMVHLNTEKINEPSDTLIYTIEKVNGKWEKLFW